MHLSFVSIFPEIFSSFFFSSLIEKAIDKNIISYSCINPRVFCDDRHQQVDDEIYGGGAGLLLKAQPIIDAIAYTVAGYATERVKIVLLGPSKTIFTQQTAHSYAQNIEHVVFVCGRYEGIDHRVELRCRDTYGDVFEKVSLGRFVTLGGELPAMVMTEAIVRLLPGVINDQASRQDESYSLQDAMSSLEYPQYTRPQEVAGYEVPDILLSGNHAKIAEWRKQHTILL